MVFDADLDKMTIKIKFIITRVIMELNQLIWPPYQSMYLHVSASEAFNVSRKHVRVMYTPLNSTFI